MSSILITKITEKFSKKGFLNSNEQILHVFQNNALVLKKTIAVTNQRVICHGGVMKDPTKKKLSGKDKGLGLIKDIHTFNYPQIMSLKVNNHILNADFEISDGSSYIVIDKMKKDTAKAAVNIINEIKYKTTNQVQEPQESQQHVMSQQSVVFCNQCGGKNTLGAKFCNACGKEIQG